MSAQPLGGPVYKICPATDLEASDGGVPQAAIDVSDGYVHLSAAHQVRETASKHFAGREGLCLVEVDPARIPEGQLRWEVSRGGDRFPHVYGEITADAVVGVDALPLHDGEHLFPACVPVPLSSDPLPGEMARRLETAEVGAMVALARSAARSIPNHAPGRAGRSLTVAARFGPQSPINGIKGWGLDDPVMVADLEAGEQLFDSVGASFAVEVSSHAHPDALAHLADRGYVAAATENVLFRGLDDVSSPSVAIELEPVRPEDANAWGAMLGLGFTGGSPPPDEFTIFGPLNLALGLSRSYFIVANDTRVGTCSMRMDHEVAMLIGSAVLAEHRGKGYHSAAVVQRLALAQALGARWAKLDVQPGSASHRNAHRAGFRLSHTRTAFVRR